MRPFLLLFPRWFTTGLFLTAVLPFVGGLISGASLFLSDSTSKPQRKRNWVLLGSLLCIVGALVGAILQGKDSYDLWAVSTGDGGYCYLSYMMKTSNALKFTISNDGEYPLYDVTLEITDLNRWDEIKSQHPEVFKQSESLLTNELADEMVDWQKQTKVDLVVGNIRPDESRWLWDAPIPKDELQRYFISIWARNGYFEQEVLLRKQDNGSFIAAFRLWRGSLREVNGKFKSQFLKEEVPDDFRHYYPTGIPWVRNIP